ncbi:MAG TPA: acyl carrier protein [Candidatus Choladousia intestinavium]|uniref:Acyl carrier protein n=1 Tax=Candidatus Choladousia intestinavium TaxID=2840727 RepID=A0A9D1DAD2_9FIRM|nr:acyl carrier protein [Candidatus Choladousia intestinavium]
MREKVLAICMSVDDSIDFTSTELIDGGLIDSVTLVEIATELMDELNIDIPYEEITPENFNSVDAITSLVERYV